MDCQILSGFVMYSRAVSGKWKERFLVRMKVVRSLGILWVGAVREESYNFTTHSRRFGYRAAWW